MKKSIICFTLLLSCLILVFSFGIKVNASSNTELDKNKIVFSLNEINSNPRTSIELSFTLSLLVDTENYDYYFLNINSYDNDDNTYYNRHFLTITKSGDDFILYNSYDQNNIGTLKNYYTYCMVIWRKNSNLFYLNIYQLDYTKDDNRPYVFQTICEKVETPITFVYEHDVSIDLYANYISRDTREFDLSSSDFNRSTMETILSWGIFANNFIPNIMTQEYNTGHTIGYNSGYTQGYNEGQTGENAISPVWNLFQGIFSTLGAIFMIELAPHVYIGYFFLVPLFFAVVGLILWIWRRN